MSEDIDRVAEMFKGKCIFVSGGTGFMGKVLVEKILRYLLFATIYKIHTYLLYNFATPKF